MRCVRRRGRARGRGEEAWTGPEQSARDARSVRGGPPSHLAVDVVVDVVGPNASAKQQELLGEEVHRHKPQHEGVRNGLQ